jgi:hypothetical protein
MTRILSKAPWRCPGATRMWPGPGRGKHTSEDNARRLPPSFLPTSLFPPLPGSDREVSRQRLTVQITLRNEDRKQIPHGKKSDD